MFSRFFIDRPIFATVIAAIILLAGILSIRGLPIEEYPQVLPPQVMVMAHYPGADAQTVANTVAAPLEQAINGVEGMIYLSSSSAASGEVFISVFFETGADADLATTNVNNRVQAALARLPAEVRAQGVQVEKRTSTILSVMTLSGDPDRYDTTYISNYALLNVVDDLKRVPGVGDVTIFGNQDYAMRIWLHPDRLAKHRLSPTDVAAAIREQNAQYAPGQLGQEPTTEGGTLYTYTLQAAGRLSSPEAFGNIVLRSDDRGTFLRLKEVATIELGARNYAFSGTMNKEPTVPIGIFLQPDANALATAQAVSETLASVAHRLPDGIEYTLPYDTTEFVRISVGEVVKTFLTALLLVSGIIFLFLQNLRATLIPVLAIPVAIIGTFAGLYALGFSINLLTLFGLVLAIGIVVDDAIIVIENVERNLRTRQLAVREATIKAMGEVTSPIIANVLVLTAVFVPVAMMGGFTGEMYRQFAVAIAVSAAISGLVALTLTPALCALLLKERIGEPIWPLRIFNALFDRIIGGFSAGVRQVLRHGVIALGLMGVMLYVTFELFGRVPGALVPMEDKGVLMVVSNLPPASSLDRTIEVRDFISEVALASPHVEAITAFAGFDLISSALKPSAGAAFVNLTDWSKRTQDHEKAQALANQFMGEFMQNPDAMIFALNPPPIMGLSLTGGFEMHIQDRGGEGVMALAEQVDRVVAKANAQPELNMVRTTLNVHTPLYAIELDRDRAQMLGVNLTELFSTMQATFGSLYVNDFNLYGRAFGVLLQADADYRRGPDNLEDVFVRSVSGEMIPLSALITLRRDVGPDVVERFNLFTSAKVMGDAAPGYSSGDAIRAIEAVASEVLDEGYTLAWSGSSYQEREMGGTGLTAFIFGVVMVFLILSALYERWLMPLAVVMAVPFAIFGAIMAVWLRGFDNELYFQIGLVVLIALAAKNAILIVEFAMMYRKRGLTPVKAAIEAARTRFRPIVMTSMAFVLAALPLALASGAGEASRQAIGTGTIGGMLSATFLAVFFIPLFYVYLTRLSEWFSQIRKGGQDA